MASSKDVAIQCHCACALKIKLLSSRVLNWDERHTVAEIRLGFGSLGFPADQTETVRQGLPAHRPRVRVSDLQEVGISAVFIIITGRLCSPSDVFCVLSRLWIFWLYLDTLLLMGFLFSRHSRAYLHALFKSDTAAMHHITIHNISYQVLTRKHTNHTHEGLIWHFILLIS